jgi:hypothetical protein
MTAPKRPGAVVVVDPVLVVLVLIAGHQLDELEVEAAADVPFVDIVTPERAVVVDTSGHHILANLVDSIDVEGTAREVCAQGVAAIVGRGDATVIQRGDW